MPLLLGLFGETRTPEALLNDNAYHLWSLSHVTRPGLGPGLFDFPKPGEHVALLLTRFAPGSSSVVTVPLKLRWNIPADRTRDQARGPRYAQTELLATPAGFIVADRGFGGFWLLPKDELEKRLEAARAPAGNPPASRTATSAP